MKISLLAANRILWRISLALVVIVVGLLAMPFWQIYGQSTSDLVIPKPVQMADSMASALPELPDIHRNIFDPTSQSWQGMGSKKSKFASGGADKNGGDITGLINIHQVQGVLVGNKFIPVGGPVPGGNLESLRDGRAVINGSQGNSEVDINSVRAQRRQKLNIQIK